MNADTYVMARADALAEGNMRVLLDRRRVPWSELRPYTQHRFDDYLATLLYCLESFILDHPHMVCFHNRTFQAVEHYKMALSAYGIACFHPEAVCLEQMSTISKQTQSGWATTEMQLDFVRLFCQACKTTIIIDRESPNVSSP